VMAGVGDRAVSETEREPWRAHATGGFAVQKDDGDHVVVRTNRRAVVRAIMPALEDPGNSAPGTVMPK
jgi:surfactin synthase thioesterase subunit